MAFIIDSGDETTMMEDEDDVEEEEVRAIFLYLLHYSAIYGMNTDWNEGSLNFRGVFVEEPRITENWMVFPSDWVNGAYFSLKNLQHPICRWANSGLSDP